MEHLMDIQNPSGHTSVRWNIDDDDEIEVARITFDSLRDKGYRAFRVGRMGRQGERMDTFDPEAGEIMMVPQQKGG